MTSEPANPKDLASRIRDERTAGSRHAPVDYGHFDIRIGRDGTWYYRGSAIRRKPLVTLFSSVLRRDETGQFWLETPAERGRIDVDDAPFTAVSMDVAGSGENQVLTFHTNLDEIVTADSEHPIRVETAPETGEPSPYVHVRDGLDALLTRPVYYQLTELADARPGDDVMGVWSAGAFFELGRVPADER